MHELLYDVNSGGIAVALLLGMVVFVEIGWRLGMRVRNAKSEPAKDHIYGVQASMLGILGLLLGFTFSLSLQRYESRSEVVQEEANAIGTTYLRADLLPEAQREPSRRLLREYVNLRAEASEPRYAEHAAQERLARAAQQKHSELWALASAGVAADAAPARSGLYVQSLNELIDVFDKRRAELARHVPEVVLIVLFGTFLLAGSVVGFACGVGGHRPPIVTYMMVALIVVVVFLILDLDRPRRGLILVSQQSLVELRDAVLLEGGGVGSRPSSR